MIQFKSFLLQMGLSKRSVGGNRALFGSAPAVSCSLPAMTSLLSRWSTHIQKDSSDVTVQGDEMTQLLNVPFQTTKQ